MGNDADKDGPMVVNIYRWSDGRTQVRAPGIDDADLVIDMLEEGLRAMNEGEKVSTQ